MKMTFDSYSVVIYYLLNCVRKRGDKDKIVLHTCKVHLRIILEMLTVLKSNGIQKVSLTRYLKCKIY